MSYKDDYIRWFDKLTSDDSGIVGGKNASLGEMIGALKEKGMEVPDGFATTAKAYWAFLEHNQLEDRIRDLLSQLRKDEKPLASVGKAIRKLFIETEFPEAIRKDIIKSYRTLSERYKADEVDVAVRSSATAEDLPEASFAGQQETFLNVSGEEELLESCRKCYASLFTDRAISYREEKGFEHMDVALSVGVQKMIRSDKAGAGVMFSIDTETGFPEVVVLNAAWGLGENVVQGAVNPDEYMVFKPLLKENQFLPILGKKVGSKEKKMIYAKGGSKTTKNVDTGEKERNRFVLKDDEILTLARWAVLIEDHYKCAMDIEWAKDGNDGKLYIVQARPETVQSAKHADTLKAYELKESAEPLLSGLSIGQAIAAGKVCTILRADEIDQFKDGAILVTEMTDPDWVPVMKRAKGIITDHGGRTCHAAIVSRELGIPAIVGTGNATDALKDDQEITMSCAEGDQGNVYPGLLEYEETEVDLSDIPDTRTEIMINMASPEASFRWWRLPSKGVGLARMEFIINNIIKIHPMALVHYDTLEDDSQKKRIRELTKAYEDKRAYFVEHLARGIAKIAAPHYPHPVIVRMSDFKTNEYANLIGGAAFEPKEENPMLGFRGASRYYSERYREGFDLECEAVKKVRNEIGMKNILIMIPFCRTLEEADKVLEVLEENGLNRGEDGPAVYVMCEIPSNALLASEFAKRFDGFSIGSNDLTQLVLGVDRDSHELSHLFDERNEAVKNLIGRVIEEAHKAGVKVGLCGQAPSDYPEFAEFLVRKGIDSISLNPDKVIEIIRHVAEVEKT